MSYRWTKSYKSNPWKSKVWSPREKEPDMRDDAPDDDAGHGYDYHGLHKFFLVLKALICPISSGISAGTKTIRWMTTTVSPMSGIRIS